jgi:hypothetical protein
VVRGDGGGNRGLFVRCTVSLGAVPLQRRAAASASAPAVVARVFVRSCRRVVARGVVGVRSAVVVVVAALLLAYRMRLLVRHQVALEGELEPAFALDRLPAQLLVISHVNLNNPQSFSANDLYSN